MNKTININLAGIIFHMDEEAYGKLTVYLTKLKSRFQKQDGGDEILADIEARIAEIFTNRLGDKREVVSMADVMEVMEILGQPEDYSDVDEEAEEPQEKEYKQSSYSSSSDTKSTFTTKKKLYRDPEDQMLGGVCAGLGHYFHVDVAWIRLGFLLTFIFGGAGFWLYIILWAVLPEAKTTAEKLHMRGERVNISNIEKSIKEEIKNMSDRFSSSETSDKIRKGGTKLGRAIEDFATAIFNVLTSIFKVAFKILGVALLVGGVFVLAILFSAAVGYGIDIDGIHLTFSDAREYFQLLVPDGYSPSYIWLAISLTVVAPLFGLVLMGARILFNYKVQNKTMTTFAGLLSFAGVVMFMILGFAIAGDFDSYERVREDYSIVNAKQDTAIEVIVNDAYIGKHREWELQDGSLKIENVDFDVRKTGEDLPYLEVVYKSNGRTSAQARDFAHHIIYNFEQKGNQIVLDRYFEITSGDQFRAQEVDVTLYLPVGYSVYLDESVRHIAYDIQNVTHTHDRHMMNHTWIMTPHRSGLQCVDCPRNIDNNDDTWDEWEQRWEEEAKEFEEQRFSKPSVPSRDSRPPMPGTSAAIEIQSPIGHIGYSTTKSLI